MKALHIRNFPDDLLRSINILAAESDMTQQEYVIAVLQQIVDNSKQAQPNKRKSQQ